ncbi:hypothetical protein JOF29_006129 [Kribbella aluminosa]|uniref:N,N-dimethylformamidase beta subunit-like C-terminal domain-containing protein n=1 Tax=Kribbella aluminosa TaxID=416017 RepID=A0ABS4UTP8_9ACTN|nr:N,N-dimethylformamidase beta subunit family domain-containing protein [Kribbella aluminosa]MBP2355019.1 hypothetical protein [Kribbella aluminosa]
MGAARTLAAGVLVLAVASACQGSTNKASNDGGPTSAPTSGTSSSPVKADEQWRIPVRQVAGPLELAGYADQVSVRSGQSFRLFVTSPAGDFTVRAFRIGWYGGAGAKLIWTSADLPRKAQPKQILTKDRMITAINWSPTTTVQTKGWPAGSYLLLLRASNGASKGKETYVPIVVRSDTARGAVLIVSGVNTDQAYNGWGGYNLYVGGPKHTHDQRSLMVTFDRPYGYNPARGVLHDNLPLVQLAERSGVRLAYATSVDLQADPGLLNGARGIVFGGHDEYWSLPMRAAVTKARDAGTNLAFLGANSVYRRMRYAADPHGPNRIIVDYKDAGLDPIHNAPDTTVNWRQNPHANPENSLVGMLYECFPASGAFTVHDPNFFLFAGTGAKAGSAYPGLVGNEADRAYPIKGTPANLQVVAHSPTTCAKRHTFSDSTYYTVKSGAGVFATGSIEWVRALLGPDAKYGSGPASVAFAQKVTLNLFTALAAGPMGRTHPAVGNLASVHDLPTTSTGTGGPIGNAPGSSGD